LPHLRRGLTDLLTAPRGDAQLARLLTGRPIRAADLARADVPPDLVSRMMDHGLLTRNGDRVVLPLQIRLVEGSVIVTDHDSRRRRADPSFVDPLWGGPTLNKLLVRGRARRALDLGCGCGVMTIAAAAFCESVVGVDINPRAIALSRFNLALNGVVNAEVRHSDLFDAVRGERFDRIMFNAPTGAELRPRNWLEAGEPILERYFSELLRHLDEDGYAHVSLCFLDHRGSTFWHRLHAWLAGQTARLQVLYIERSHVDGGVPFLRWQLTGLLRDRANVFDVTAVSRGWLVLTRGEPRALRLRLDYKRVSNDLRTEFGDRLVRRLFASDQNSAVDDIQAVWAAPADVIGDCLRQTQPITWS
jgi:SAM-dependent methyltransferase